MTANSNNSSTLETEKILDNLNYFLDFFLQDQNIDLASITPPIHSKPVNCWEEKNCQQNTCPVYKNLLGRCWLTEGALCCGDDNGIFARKFSICKECKVYKKSIQLSPLAEINEKLLIIIHELYHKQSQLNQWATTDFLTGLFNRRYFDLFIQSEIEKVKRNDYQLYITLIDINDFKMINDQFGHLTGDNILKECAKILTKVTRKSDLLIRYGGDEFLVVCYGPHTDELTVEQHIKRVITEVNKWNNRQHYANLKLSLSFGYSALNDRDNFEDIIAQADRNMYDYKKQLKNADY